jgi:hypothetical protein
VNRRRIGSGIRAAVAAAGVVVAVSAMALTPAGAQSDPASTTTSAPSGSTGAPTTPSGDGAIDDLVGCVQGSRQLLVLFLIDESASLKQSDPDDRRVDAARGALDSLVALSSAEGAASPKVDVALAAFSNEFRLVQDWTPVDTDTAGSLNRSLDQFADFENGTDTDFVNALSAGRESLADQSATITADGESAPCRAVMLFTDGGFDLAVRRTAEEKDRLGTTKPYAPGVELTSDADVLKAEALGRKALCKPGGVADRLRSDDVTLITVALSGKVSRRAQLPLAAATAGKADDYTCGTQPGKGEATRAPGAYLPAEDIDVLVTQFNGVGVRLAGGSPVPGSDQVKICGAEPCDEGSRTFALDKTLRRAQIVALAAKAGTSVVLEAPNGDTTTVTKAGTSSVGGIDVTARSLAGRGLAIDLNRSATAASWNGRWKASIIDPDGTQEGDPATLQVFVFSDIAVSLGRTSPLERGAETDFEVLVNVPDGVKASDVIKSSEAVMRLSNPVTGTVETVPLDGPVAGPFTGTYTTPSDTTSNVIEATAEVRLTTAGGAALVSQSPSKELTVRRPKGSIQFAPGSLTMPSLTGYGTTEIDLLLVGGDTAGCVWFGKATVPEPPEGAGTITVTSDGDELPGKTSCIPVAAGKVARVKLDVAASGRASGSVRGNLVVYETTQGRDSATTTEIPFHFDMARGVDQARRLLLSIVLMVAGLGLPLGALVLLNARTARFQSLDAIQGAALPVRISGRSITRTDRAYGRPLTLRSEDFGSLAAAGDDRRFAFGGVEFRARGSRNPFGATIAMAAPEGGAEKLKGGEGSRVELDPSLAGSWIFLLDSHKTRQAARGDVEGLLIAFVAEGDIAAQTSRMLPDITQRLPSTAATLAGLVRTTRRKPVSSRRKRRTDPSTTPDETALDDQAADADPSRSDSDISDAASTHVAEPDATAPAAERPDEVNAPETPEAPIGFGGAPRGEALPPAPPTPPPMGPSGSSDDGPPTPPAGFSGTRPDA